MEPVIVIHGTFANEARWWRPDGSFCSILNGQLKLLGSEAKCWDSIPTEEIGEFGWSGLNSEASRTHAAEMLAERILSLSQRVQENTLRCVQPRRQCADKISAFVSQKD